MVRLNFERLKNILEALATRCQTQEGFMREAKSTFLMIGDEPTGITFKNELAEAMTSHKFVLDFVTESMIETIQRLNHPALTQCFAKRLPENVRKVHFPEISEDGAPGTTMGTTTTTANTAPFAIPLGSLAPSKNRGPDYTGFSGPARKRNKKKKAKKR